MNRSTFCPSPTPRVHSNPCPLSRWCHPIISSSVIPFASCPQSFPASGSFQMSQLFKKIRVTKGTFQAKMGSMKDRNGMDLTEAEDIKKRWQEYTEELHQKDLQDPNNHKGVITHTHLEPDILECEVKWALGSITTNKASRDDGIPLSYFESWKMMLLKCCTQYASKFGKLSSGHRTGKGQFSFQSQRKPTPKNAQTTAQLHSSHMLVK